MKITYNILIPISVNTDAIIEAKDAIKDTINYEIGQKINEIVKNNTNIEVTKLIAENEHRITNAVTKSVIEIKTKVLENFKNNSDQMFNDKFNLKNFINKLFS